MTPFEETFYEAAGPIMRFVSHSLAVALGLVLLTMVLLIPVGLVHGLEAIGLTEHGALIHKLDRVLLWVELALFGITLAIGALELLAVQSMKAVARVKQNYLRIFVGTA